MNKILKLKLIVAILFLCMVFNIEDSYAADKDWYKDYTYTLVQNEGGTNDNYIILTRYNKKAKKLVVPTKATIDGVTYKTKLMPLNESIWSGTKDRLTSIKFGKGCVVSNGSFMFMDLNKLNSVNVENLNMSEATSTAWMFANCSSLTKLKVDNWDLSNVTNMFNMFGGCEKLSSLNVSKWDTSKVTVMTSVFDHCKSLNKINVKNWDVSNVTVTEFMFYNCEKLRSLDLHKWDTSNVTNMFEMFGRCYSLNFINVKGWDTSNVINMSGLFVCNFNLKSLDLSSFDMSKVVFGKYDDDMIFRCPSLKTVKTPKNVKAKITLNSGLTYVKKNGSKLGTKEYTYIPKGKKSITMVCVQGKSNSTSIQSIRSSGGRINIKINPVKSSEWFIPTQYEVQCSTNKNFTDAVGTVANTLESTYSVQGNVIDKTSATIKGLKKGRTYYVRVRVCEYEKRISDWSKVKKIKVK